MKRLLSGSGKEALKRARPSASSGALSPRWRFVPSDKPLPGDLALPLGSHPASGGGSKPVVLQWMSRDQRIDDSWSAIEAARVAAREGAEHHVAFCLLDSFLGAGHRQFAFMLSGLREVEARCRELGIGFHLVRARGPRGPAPPLPLSLPQSSNKTERGGGRGGVKLEPGVSAAEPTVSSSSVSSGAGSSSGGPVSDGSGNSGNSDKFGGASASTSTSGNLKLERRDGRSNAAETPAAAIAALARELGAGLVVTDFSPMRCALAWQRELRALLPAPVEVVEVDAHNIVPCWIASNKLEYAARTFRPKFEALATPGLYLTDFPEIEDVLDGSARVAPAAAAIDWAAVDASLDGIDRTIAPVDWAVGGRAAGMARLRDFTDRGLAHYDKSRNDPCKDATSKLSPWLHFGHVSSQRAVLLARASRHASVSFVEEIGVRRELCDNFCLHQPLYDSVECASKWALDSLRLHQADPRPATYTLEELRDARTGDPLWNAAQRQLVQRGHMTGWCRMYWAKRFLEWTASPEDAMAAALYLNDLYELDGRSPGGYVGVAWSILGIHDMGWTERPIFGKVRFMNLAGARRKFKVDEFCALYPPTDAAAGKDAGPARSVKREGVKRERKDKT
jgi:deoxyribodipyrimidine photo-lyase